MKKKKNIDIVLCSLENIKDFIEHEYLKKNVWHRK